MEGQNHLLFSNHAVKQMFRRDIAANDIWENGFKKENIISYGMCYL